MVFINTSYLKILLVSLPLVVFYLLYNPSNFTFSGHFIGLVISEVFLFLIILIFGLDNDERNVLKSTINRIMRKDAIIFL